MEAKNPFTFVVLFNLIKPIFMKTARFFGLFAVVTVLVLSSCSKDPAEILPGSWDTSDGGEITFNADGTGNVSGSDFFLIDYGNGPIENFTWSSAEADVTADGTLFMDFVDSLGTATLEYPLTFRGKNEVQIGIDFVFNIDLLTLSRQ